MAKVPNVGLRAAALTQPTTVRKRMTPLRTQGAEAATAGPSRRRRQPGPRAPLARRRPLAHLLAGFADPLADITGTTPTHDTAPSPLRWSARPRAPHGRWATRAGRSPGSRLGRIASTFPPSPAVASGAMLAAYSCGGSRGFEARGDLAPRSLFHSPHPIWARRDRHAASMEAKATQACQQRNLCTHGFRLHADRAATPSHDFATYPRGRSR
jgi:hypothetical protein